MIWADTAVPAAHKLLGARPVKLRLAAGCVTALGLGLWLTPPAVPTTLSAPQERAAPLLEEQVQLREAVRPFRGVQHVAGLVRSYGVAIQGRANEQVPVLSDFGGANDGSRPIGFGVVVSETQVLTHAHATGGQESMVVATVNGSHEMRVAAYDPATGLVLLQAATPIGLPAPLALGRLLPGALTVAAASAEGREITVPLFVASVASDRYIITAAGPTGT